MHGSRVVSLILGLATLKEDAVEPRGEKKEEFWVDFYYLIIFFLVTMTESNENRVLQSM